MSSNPTVLAQKEPGKIAAPRPDNSNLVTALDRLGETPEYIDCPFCRKRTLTTVTQNNSDATCMATCLCYIATGIIGVCIPSLCHWCADTDHHCSECKQLVMHKPHDGLPQAKYPASEPRQGPSDYALMPDPIRPQLDRPWSEDQGMNGTRGSVKEGSSVIKEDSNVMKEDSNVMKEDSNVNKEESSLANSGQNGRSGIQGTTDGTEVSPKEKFSMEKSRQKVQLERQG